jgi:4-aminobutyrate aminotransferase-like enzyme/Ser/Thr protein kinase RdoA (MazF antagonist)
MNSEARSPQAVSTDDAAQLARELYGFEVCARSLPGEYDNNFHVTTSDGRAFVLKVMHPSRERAFIDMQCAALAHLAEHAPDLALQRVQWTRSGEAFAKATLRNGEERFVWLLSFLPGRVLAEVRPHTPELFRSLGSLLGQIDLALQGFSHPAAHRELKWDLAQAAWIREYLFHIKDPSRRALVERVLERYATQVEPHLATLRKSTIYGDANDYNVLLHRHGSPSRDRVSVIDFGDMHHGLVVAEPAVAAAYAVLGKADPLAAAAAVLEGFHGVFPLQETELAIMFPLICMRLAVSVVNSAYRKTLVPDDPYVVISEAPAWEALVRLAQIHERFAHYAFRNACGLPPLPAGEHFRESLANYGKTAASVVDADLHTAPCLVFDLSVGSTFLGADPKAQETTALASAIDRELQRAHAAVGIGRYDEPRLLYTSALFAGSESPVDERRTVHLGMDLFLDAGSNVRAPLDGTVYIIADNAAHLDYGPVVILRHLTDEVIEFFTLYGHLSRESIAKLFVGQPVGKGQAFAKIGTTAENGGWPPHLHFQIIADLLEMNETFPGVARASDRAIWKDLSPDPNLVLGIPSRHFPAQERSATDTLLERRSLMGRNLSVSYQHPLKIVRGWQQYLYDDTGGAYLDVYNNVPMVGHSHPRVVDAVRKQLGLLNTNTRYLHDNVVEYAERLTRTLPAPLRICYFLNSGSEANELALRLARAHTNYEDIIVLEHAYHGHTNTLIDISPYKFNGPGGKGRKSWVHVAPIADDYRGIYRRGEPNLGTRYASHIEEILHQLQVTGRGAAAFIAETMPSVGGQIVFPPGYLAEAYRHVRAAGGVCIADEVQVGFGRLGSHFWGFETQGVVPDIVVLGKPIGNAFPLAAVITTPEIARSFDNGMEFFSTFGGNPVSCAAGLAVLDVLRDERLQENALRVGNGLCRRLEELQERHPIIGDVRGSGLFLGVDLVKDRATREAATEQASYICNRLRERGILTGTDGPWHNVLKLRPPLIFSDADAELFVTSLGTILEEDYAQPGTAQ